MPIDQLAYLGMVIGGMTLFLVTLAWGCWYTRGADSKAGAPKVVDLHPTKPEAKQAA
jgi:hypothetical protein